MNGQAEHRHDLVVFGATGDLTGRYLLPALAQLDAAGLLPDGMRIRGVGREDHADADFRSRAGGELARHAPEVGEGARAALVARWDYRRADVGAAAEVARALDGLRSPVVYLALPAALFTPAVRALAGAGLPTGSRVVLEKPYGTDRDDVAALAGLLEGLVGAGAVFRVDHFLAEATVRNILGLRFANRVFEPVWNATHVQRVEVIWDETLTLEGRASYYDRAGALRDVVANHLLQVMSLVAMEPPRTLAAPDLHRAKLDLLRAVRTPVAGEIGRSTRRARYTAGRIGDRAVPDYLAEPGVQAANATETLAEIDLWVDNPRWSGVRFRLRSGKALARPRAEIALHFRPVATPPFTHGPAGDANVLHLDLDPERLRLRINLTGPGDAYAVEPAVLGMDLAVPDLSPYAQVLRDILRGHDALSVQSEEVEQSWRIVEPILDRWAAGEPPLGSYPAGSPGFARPGGGPLTVVVTGAAGAGKSTVGAAVAARLGWDFVDADDLHSAAGVAKMAAGTPLAEADRAGWLTALAEWIGARERGGHSSVLACSALRRSHRERLRRGHDSVRFVHLCAPEATLRDRMERRRGHFMPPSLLGDQLATLEPLHPDEPGFTIDAGAAPEGLTDRILQALKDRGSPVEHGKDGALA